MSKLKIIIADDERPAREFLKSLLRDFENVELLGEAETGIEAVELIKSTKPDLALLDLQMPEAGGLDVVKLLRKNQMPLVAFVTAYDEYAVKAFELNAIDYLLKPVEKSRLRETIERAAERLEHTETKEAEAEKVKNVVKSYEDPSEKTFLDRIPVKKREEIYLVQTDQVSSISADGELLHIITKDKEKFTINYRLKDLELRLNPEKFIRLSRGTIVNLDMVSRVSPMPGGTYTVILKDSQEHSVSRIQSRILRERLFKL